MGETKRYITREIVLFIFLLFLVFAAYKFLFTPKNSLELYQAIRFSDNYEEVQKLMLEDYVGNFEQDDYEFIVKTENEPNRIPQFTLFEYDDKTIVVLTTPGTEKLKILAVDELPEEVRKYFIELSP
jgi:hypothetical protein